MVSEVNKAKDEAVCAPLGAQGESPFREVEGPYNRPKGDGVGNLDPPIVHEEPEEEGGNCDNSHDMLVLYEEQSDEWEVFCCEERSEECSNELNISGRLYTVASFQPSFAPALTSLLTPPHLKVSWGWGNFAITMSVQPN